MLITAPSSIPLQQHKIINKGNKSPRSSSSYGPNNKPKTSSNQILFQPNIKTPTASTAQPVGSNYSQNISRQRTFTSYYSSLGDSAHDKLARGQTIHHSHIQKLTARQQHSPYFDQNKLAQLSKPDPSIKEIVRAARTYTSNSEIFEAPSTSLSSENFQSQQSAALNQIKDNYSRNLANLSGSLDLIKVTSSTAAKLFADSKTTTVLNMNLKPFRYGSTEVEGVRVTGAKSAAPVGRNGNKPESSSVKEYLILKLKKKQKDYHTSSRLNSGIT